ncbi:MAG: MFS family permease [Flavobacteriaceae bacterium]|jgi:MFS family permease
MKTTTQKLQSNIWKSVIYLITQKRTYLTFLTIYLLTFPDATVRTIGLVSFLSQVAGFFFEIPSGYIADKIGHKNALVISKTCMVVSTACYVFANSISWFIIGGIITSLGFAFSSGTFKAFLHETLTSLKREANFSKIYGRMKSISFAIPVVFILLLAFVAEFDYKMAFVVALVLDVIGLVFTSILFSPSIKEEIQEINIMKNFSSILREWKNAGWLPYIGFTIAVMALYLSTTIGFKNPFQESLGFSISMLGIFLACSRGIASILLLTNGFIYKLFNYKNFLIFKTFLFLICFSLIAFVQTPWVVAVSFMFIPGIMWGFSATDSQHQLGFIIDSKNKATLFSINALIEKFFTGILAVGMGILILNSSYFFAYQVVALVFLVLIIIAFFILPRRNKKLA